MLRKVILLPLLMLSGAAPMMATASPPPSAQPLPSPTPLPEERIIPGIRTPTQEAAELAWTRDPDTWVYVVNGMDPFHWAQLKQLADRLRLAGFPNTKFGEYYDMPAFEEEIKRIRCTKPHARIALIGYSAGSYTVLASTHRLLREGYTIDMLGYIGGDMLENTGYCRPPQVRHVVNITGNGFLLTGYNLVWNGTTLNNAANLRLRGVKHFDLPQHPETFRWLYDGLIRISSSYSFPEEERK